MKHVFRFAPLLGLLTACDAAPHLAGDATSAVPPIAEAPIALPMDPAQITCRQQLASEQATTAAVAWMAGQMRAAILAGTIPAPIAPATPEIVAADFLSAYCRTDNGSIGDAYQAMIAG